MSINTTDNAAAIDAISTATEYLQCATRAIAHGADPSGAEVFAPVTWAVGKLAEVVDATTLCAMLLRHKQPVHVTE